MRVIFSHSLPFFLAHGGTQTLVEALLRELPAFGVDAQPERWWDGAQSGDILHFIGRPPSSVNVRLAREKGFRIVMTEFLDQTASRPRPVLWSQRAVSQLACRVAPGLVQRQAWDIYQTADALIYATALEWETAQFLFGAPPGRGHVIGHGLTEEALAALREPAAAADHLVSVATIAERKNTVLLAEAARRAQVPVVFLGKPYAEDDPYFLRFKALVDDRWVRYAGFVSEAEKRQWLRTSRGFALLSRFESGCIAVYEAAAAGLPLFLPDLPWAAKVYARARQVTFARPGSPDAVARELARFAPQARRLDGPTFPVPSWREVAQQYAAVYRRVAG